MMNDKTLEKANNLKKHIDGFKEILKRLDEGKGMLVIAWGNEQGILFPKVDMQQSVDVNEFRNDFRSFIEEQIKIFEDMYKKL